MLQIKQKRGTGVESPSPRSFSGGVAFALHDSSREGFVKDETRIKQHKFSCVSVDSIDRHTTELNSRKLDQVMVDQVTVDPDKTEFTRELSLKSRMRGYYGEAMISRLLENVGFFCRI